MFTRILSAIQLPAVVLLASGCVGAPTSYRQAAMPAPVYAPPPPEAGENIAAYLAKHADGYRDMDELGVVLPYDPRPPEARPAPRPPPTDADWIASYTFRIEPPDTLAAQAALADEAPNEFRAGMGREPPHDLVARVLAELRHHYPLSDGT